jgi:phosphoribosylformylglycinamidine (FGAM) synthase-like enzyme
MAFDFTKLDGFKPEMTAEEKLALLDKYEPDKPDLTGYIQKSTFDKTASELAEAKRQLKAKQTEEERKEAERLEAEAAMKAELEALRREKTISDSKAKFLGLGYDEKLATETAKALADGDMEKVFANQQIHIENVKKAERAAALAGDQKPPAGKNDPPKGDRAKLIEQYNEAEKRGDFVMCQTLQAQIKALPKE